MSDYEIYGEPVMDAAPSYDAPGIGDGPWIVLIEYSNGGQAKPPTKVEFGRTVHKVRADALAAAQRAAFEYDPPDPWSIQDRKVYRDGPDGFLVTLQGATTVFHMSVRLVQPVTRP